MYREFNFSIAVISQINIIPRDTLTPLYMYLSFSYNGTY